MGRLCIGLLIATIMLGVSWLMFGSWWYGHESGIEWGQENIILPRDDGMPVIPEDQDIIMKRGDKEYVIPAEKGKHRERVRFVVDRVYEEDEPPHRERRKRYEPEPEPRREPPARRQEAQPRRQEPPAQARTADPCNTPQVGCPPQLSGRQSVRQRNYRQN